MLSLALWNEKKKVWIFEKVHWVINKQRTRNDLNFGDSEIAFSPLVIGYDLPISLTQKFSHEIVSHSHCESFDDWPLVVIPGSLVVGCGYYITIIKFNQVWVCLYRCVCVCIYIYIYIYIYTHIHTHTQSPFNFLF